MDRAPSDVPAATGLAGLLSAVLSLAPDDTVDPHDHHDQDPYGRYRQDLYGRQADQLPLPEGAPGGPLPALMSDLRPAEFRLSRAVARLSPDVRAFVHVYFHEGRPLDAAASRLGISRLDALALRSLAIERITDALIEDRRG